MFHHLVLPPYPGSHCFKNLLTPFPTGSAGLWHRLSGERHHAASALQQFHLHRRSSKTVRDTTVRAPHSLCQQLYSYVLSVSLPIYAQSANPSSVVWEHLPNSTNLTASARSDLAAYPSDWPDLQYIFNAVGFTSDVPGDYIAIGVVLMKTTSRGNVTINSTDTSDNPVVSVNWLLSSTDQLLAVQSVRRSRIFAGSFGVISGPEILPGPAAQTDAEILTYIQESAGPSHHAVASCRMGKKNDPMTVVDSHGRVLGGVTGLRIVDASIMPLLPPGQPMSTVYMLAEKLTADLLRGE